MAASSLARSLVIDETDVRLDRHFSDPETGFRDLPDSVPEAGIAVQDSQLAIRSVMQKCIHIVPCPSAESRSQSVTLCDNDPREEQAASSSRLHRNGIEIAGSRARG